MPPAQDEKQNDQMEMIMKKIIGSTLVAIALIGSAVSVSAAPAQVPGHDASLQQSLNFWQQFADRND
jgi:hypothetical protein